MSEEQPDYDVTMSYESLNKTQLLEEIRRLETDGARVLAELEQARQQIRKLQQTAAILDNALRATLHGAQAALGRIQ